MIYAVNLLPDSCHHLRRRAVRRNAWTIIVGGASLLVAGTWIGLQAVNRTLTRLERELGGIQIKQTEIDRQLVFACAERNALADRALALAALCRGADADDLPHQLYELSRLAPEGVVLSEIASLPPDPSQRPAPSDAKASANARVFGPQTDRALRVQITGFARDHSELTRFIDAVERIQSWQHVELERAALEPFHSGRALAFKLVCRRMEEAK